MSMLLNPLHFFQWFGLSNSEIKYIEGKVSCGKKNFFLKKGDTYVYIGIVRVIYKHI